MTDLRKAAQEAAKVLANALSIDFNDKRDWYSYKHDVEYATNLLRQALAQPKYHRGDRLLCLESEEYCVIHISGTDRQWVKFPDSHIGVYTNEQVQELFELLPKETDEALAQPEQEPVAVIGNWGRVEWAEGVFPQLGDKMYAAPPKREWVGLTEEERDKIILGCQQRWEIAHMIEAKLKEKNT